MKHAQQDGKMDKYFFIWIKIFFILNSLYLEREVLKDINVDNNTWQINHQNRKADLFRFSQLPFQMSNTNLETKSCEELIKMMITTPNPTNYILISFSPCPKIKPPILLVLHKIRSILLQFPKLKCFFLNKIPFFWTAHSTIYIFFSWQ